MASFDPSELPGANILKRFTRGSNGEAHAPKAKPQALSIPHQVDLGWARDVGKQTNDLGLVAR